MDKQLANLLKLKAIYYYNNILLNKVNNNKIKYLK